MVKLLMFSRWFAVGAVVFFLGSMWFGDVSYVAVVWLVAAVVLVLGVAGVDAVRGRRR